MRGFSEPLTTAKDDLNSFDPQYFGTYPALRNADNSTRASDGTVAVYFRNLLPRLLEHIREADAVFGCVAWLTHFGILDALRRKHVAIVVQKEDFLRPDLGASSRWKQDLRAKYDALHCDVFRIDFQNMMRDLSTGGDPTQEAVRCVGNFNRVKVPAFPRMHNKFLIFANVDDSSSAFLAKPYAVWTGSFNLTANAVVSLENAMYITHPEIVDAYFQEFGQIMAISEQLDWESDWIQPELEART